MLKTKFSSSPCTSCPPWLILLFPANRYALVIGNGAYKDSNFSCLANPVNDAADVAAALKELGYSVTLKTNLGLRELLNAILDFTGTLKFRCAAK